MKSVIFLNNNSSRDLSRVLLQSLMLCLVFIVVSFSAQITRAENSNKSFSVVVSIKPIYSLVSAVMEGISEPVLLVDGFSSPHDYALKPSQAKALENADVIFWIGDGLERFLSKSVQTIGQNAKSVELIDAKGLYLRQYPSEHDDHGEEHAGHDDHDGHGTIDPHIWLDPVNAKFMIKEILRVLVEADPKNGEVYQSNSYALLSKIEELQREINDELSDVKDKSYLVFHDAYHYFENRFDMKTSGSVSINPEVGIGAKKLKELREQISKSGVVCLFSEPQFDENILEVIQEGQDINIGVLDPIGAELEAGPKQYIEMLRNMANSFRECLK